MDSRANLLSIWWIFVLGLIAGGIVIGVTIYYSADININEMHADVLGSRISDCMVVDGKIINLEGFELLSNCKIDGGVFNNGKFFARILIYDGNVIFDEVYGDTSMEEDCNVIAEVSSKGPLRCAKRREVASYDGNEVVVEIMSGVKQEGEIISIVK